MRSKLSAITTAVGLATLISIGAVSASFAQCAGCGADYNRGDRRATAREAENQRLQRVDPPIKKDPLGNALIGGGVSGALRGAAAGVSSVFTGTATGAASNEVRDRRRK